MPENQGRWRSALKWFHRPKSSFSTPKQTYPEMVAPTQSPTAEPASLLHDVAQSALETQEFQDETYAGRIDSVLDMHLRAFGKSKEFYRTAVKPLSQTFERELLGELKLTPGREAQVFLIGIHASGGEEIIAMQLAARRLGIKLSLICNDITDNEGFKISQKQWREIEEQGLATGDPVEFVIANGADLVERVKPDTAFAVVARHPQAHSEKWEPVFSAWTKKIATTNPPSRMLVTSGSSGEFAIIKGGLQHVVEAANASVRFKENPTTTSHFGQHSYTDNHIAVVSPQAVPSVGV